MYATTLLCTGISRPPLTFKPPIPIDIESDLGALVGAAPYSVSGPYGLPTGDLLPLVRRNYEPHRQGWRVSGTLSGFFSASGYTEAPGEIDEDNPIIFPPDPLIVPFSIDIDSGPPAGRPVVRPEFATTSRIIAELTHEENYISEAFFPVGRNEAGQLKGCFLITTFRIAVELLPYSWEYRGSYYLEHQISVSVSRNALFFPIGGEEFSFDESVEAGPGGNVSTQLPGPNIRVSGSVGVRDPLMTTEINWGSLPFWGSSQEASQPVGLLEPRLSLSCSVHYLRSPDL